MIKTKKNKKYIPQVYCELSEHEFAVKVILVAMKSYKNFEIL